jgi:hypothetical protein
MGGGVSAPWARAFVISGRECLAVISRFDTRAIPQGTLRAATAVKNARASGLLRIPDFLTF